MIDPLPRTDGRREFGPHSEVPGTAPLAMVLFDPQWLGVLAVNPAALALYGYTRAEFMRLSIADLFSASDLMRFLQSIEPRSDASGTIGVWHQVCRDGRIVAVDAQVEAFEHRGHPATLVAMRVVGGTDTAPGSPVPSERGMSLTLRPVADAGGTHLLGRLSHELRTPLNAVIGFSELLAAQDDGFDDTRSRYLEHILDAGRHLLALVDDVLDLQRIDERRMPLTLRPIELASFITTESTLLLPLLGRKNLTMVNEVPDGLVVLADEKCLRQALVNLAGNAIKYNRPSGVVRWSAGVLRAGFAVLRVADTGEGISREHLARLFQPFDRIGHDASAAGSGLGLLIARGLIEHMGGRLEIESGVGVGTQALVELPLAEPHSLFGDLGDGDEEEAADPSTTEPAAVRDDAEASAGAQVNLMPMLRLLYVEDNRINAMLFEAVLGARQDIELRIAESGADALEIVRGWTPDALILDAHLPDTHGVLLLKRLRQVEALKTTPAFMCSADALEDDIRLARDAGFLEYWTKPVDFNKVMRDLRGLSAHVEANPED